MTRPAGEPAARGGLSGIFDSRHAARLTEAVAGVLGMSGGAVIVMTALHTRALVHATDVAAHRLDQLQFDLGEGPCLDAFRDEEAVLVPDVDDRSAEVRWPLFAAAASALRVVSLLAIPLVSGGSAFGALEMHSFTPVTVDDRLDTATALARAAGDWVLQDYAELSARAGDLGGRADVAATWGHAMVHRASGMLSVQQGISVDDALALLRSTAFSEGVSIEVAAHRVVAPRR